MNHQVPQYNQNVPILSHTDWASMAKQWATLRANVNIPPTVNKVEHYTYQNIPPPPPPPPSLSIPKPNIIPYNNEYQSIPSHDVNIPFNRNTPINHTNNVNTNIYEPPAHSIFEDPLSTIMKSQCETFDYNHRDRPFVNFNNVNAYRPPPVTNNFTPNMFNLPPPTHQDYVEPQQLKPSYVPDPTPAKLFPINNNEYDLVKSQPLMSTSPMSLPIKPHHPINKYSHRSNFPTNRSNKGLPKWIIDDMKKIKEKERKQPFALMDDYRDHPVNSKRDEEGDIVMEDDQMLKDSELDGVLSGKSVITANRIDSVATDVDIDDVNLIDEDEGVDKLDYSSKSLGDLIEMLDETELDNLKIAIIRDSLTGVMKQVTDEMIIETVNVTFSQELDSTLSSTKARSVKTLSRDSKTVNCNSDSTVKPIDPPAINTQNEQTCYLLGLDAYESDDESTPQETARDNTAPDSKPIDTGADKPSSSVSESGRERWSSHKKPSSVDQSKPSDKNRPSSSSSAALTKNSTATGQASVSTSSSSKDHHTSISSSPGSKSIRHRNRSKSRERSHKSSKSRDHHRRRSRSKDRKHKSKKHSHSRATDHNNGNDYSNHNYSNPSSMSNSNSDNGTGARWKNDKCDSVAVSRKHGKRERSRS